MNHTSVRVLPCCSQGMVRRWSVAPAFFLLAILLSASSTWSQGNQGTLEGSVSDPSGAAVAGAQLTVTNDATGLKFQTTTDSDGLFTFPVLPVGSYTVEVGHAGFSKLTRKDVKLTVGARLNLALALSVAGQGESVTVTSETPLVETTAARSAPPWTANPSPICPSSPQFHQFRSPHPWRDPRPPRWRHQLRRTARHPQFSRRGWL